MMVMVMMRAILALSDFCSLHGICVVWILLILMRFVNADRHLPILMVHLVDRYPSAFAKYISIPFLDDHKLLTMYNLLKDLPIYLYLP